MGIRKAATVLALSIAVLAATPALAQAAPSAGTGTGIVASYKGKKIDLSKGWQGAQACAEFAIGDVRCYDTTQEADQAITGGFQTMASGDCPSGWVCLWESGNYAGRRLQWSASGTKKLADWDFRDKASAAFARRPQGGIECIDYRTGQPDPHLFLAVATYYPELVRISHVYGGSWNDKIDEIRI
jgi:hypothetical protein